MTKKPITITKVCTNCCKLLDITCFYLVRKDGHLRDSRCSECAKKNSKAWYHAKGDKNRKRAIANATAWNNNPANAERRKAAWTKWNRKRGKKASE